MSTSPIDLTTIANVKAYQFSANGITTATTQDDAEIQSLITGWSRTFLERVDRDPANAAQTIFNGVQNFSRRFDGSGHDEMLLPYWPVVSVTNVVVGTRTISESPDAVQPGWMLSPDADALVLICDRFERGRLNINVSWTAGYTETPEDIVRAANKMIAIEMKRRQTLDQGSITLPNGGTTSFRSWEWPPDVERTVNNYRRGWI